MPYAKKKCKIPLCKTCAEYYGAKADAEIVVVDYAKECIAHYVDLDTIVCIKRIKDDPPEEKEEEIAVHYRNYSQAA